MGCLPAGFKNVNPGNKRQMEDRLEVERLTVAAGAEEIPALTETQIYNATKKAIDLFDKNYLLFRKQNKKKGLIVPSIAVSAEGLHPDTGKNTGCLIEKEMEQASLWSSSGMANLVRLHKGTSCYENPTVEEQKRLGPPGKLLFNAEGNKQLAMKVEKALQVYLLYRGMIAQEDIKLLQLTAGCGSLRGNPPYKVGYRFFFLETIKEMGFVFKDALSPKQLLFSRLPKKSTKAKKVVKKSNNPITLYYSKKAVVELLDSEDNESDSEDKSEKKIFAPRVSESPQLEDLVDTDKDGDSRPAQKFRRLAFGVYCDTTSATTTSATMTRAATSATMTRSSSSRARTTTHPTSATMTRAATSATMTRSSSSRARTTTHPTMATTTHPTTTTSLLPKTTRSCPKGPVSRPIATGNGRLNTTRRSPSQRIEMCVSISGRGAAERERERGGFAISLYIRICPCHEDNGLA
jgi:hypothetical protein